MKVQNTSSREPGGKLYARVFAPWQQRLAVALSGELIVVDGVALAVFEEKTALDKHTSICNKLL